MNVIGYARVSTEEQATGGVSLDAQVAKLRAYCELHELTLVDVVIDAGQSAKTLNRPGLQRALSMLRRKQAEGFLVCKLDRLSRSVKDWNTLIDGYFGDRAGKQLFSVADSIDTRTAAGRLVLNVLMSVAQWEREAIGERTRDAMHHKRTKGERVSRHIPFGWNLDGAGTLVQNVAEQQIIARIQSLRTAGKTLQQIAGILNEEGIQAKQGGAWQHTSIRAILKRNAA